MAITHEEQRDAWEKEHKNPYALVQMDKREPSKSVLWFLEFLKRTGKTSLSGVEMGCGKGRNVLATAREDFVSSVHGFDFSAVAIEEAKRRAHEVGAGKAEFRIMDATKPWEFPSESFDFGIDCAASTDIESKEGREFAAKEFTRVLKSGGYLMVMAMSEDDEYHVRMREESPAEESGAFYHKETGKFEKFFTADELDALHAPLQLVEAKRHIGTVRFFGISYGANLHWRIYQKP